MHSLGVPKGHVPQGDLAREYAELKGEIDEAVGRVLTRGYFLLGPETEAFESEFAAWLGRKHIVACACGTEAITLALLALGVGPGDEVLVPTNTCVPTATGVRLTGAKPVPTDIDARTLTMCPQSARRVSGPKTKAVIPVHLYGGPANLDALKELGFPLVEDCAQSHGAVYRGRKAGAIGVLSCFSFYPSKNLGAYGDAGAVATDDAALAERLRRLRNYGQVRRDHHEEEGLNSRIDELQAAILRVKLRRLNTWNAKRAVLAKRLDEALKGLPGLSRPETVEGGSSVHHLYPVLSERRDALQGYLEARGVRTRIHYPTPLHLQPCYRSWGIDAGSLPAAEAASKRLLSLPFFAHLRDEELESVAELVRQFHTSDHIA